MIVVVLFGGMQGIAHAADEIEGAANSNQVLDLVTTYMQARKAILSKQSVNGLDDISVIGIINDEIKHKEILETKNIEFIDSEFHILDEYENELELCSSVLETVTYQKNGLVLTENIEHEIFFMKNSGNVYITVADLYTEKFSGFDSCSYIPPNDIVLYAANIGSAPCLVYVAQTQIGYKEKASNSNLDSFTENAGSNNYTKYGVFTGFNGQPWCASFVSWCAFQAKVSTTVITKTSNCDTLMNPFKQSSRYYLSASYGGSYRPVAGDIFSMGDVQNDSSHVGIVVSSNANTISVIHGNSSYDDVRTQSYSITDSRLLGFGHPNYAEDTHTWVATSGHYVCSACGKTENFIPVEP